MEILIIGAILYSSHVRYPIGLSRSRYDAIRADCGEPEAEFYQMPQRMLTGTQSVDAES
jgi:hypothetical protein